MKANGTALGTDAPASLPTCSHTPAPYDGPSRDEVLAMRRQYLTPGLITYMVSSCSFDGRERGL